MINNNMFKVNYFKEIPIDYVEKCTALIVSSMVFFIIFFFVKTDIDVYIFKSVNVSRYIRGFYLNTGTRYIYFCCRPNKLLYICFQFIFHLLHKRFRRLFQSCQTKLINNNNAQSQYIRCNVSSQIAINYYISIGRFGAEKLVY